MQSMQRMQSARILVAVVAVTNPLPSLFRPAFWHPAARCFIELLPSQELLDVGLGVVLVFLVPRLDEVQVVNCLANTVDRTARAFGCFWAVCWGEACCKARYLMIFVTGSHRLCKNVKHFFIRFPGSPSPCLGANGAMAASNHDDLCRTVLQGRSPCWLTGDMNSC